MSVVTPSLTFATAFVVSAALYPATNIATLPLSAAAYGLATTFIKYCPAPTLVASLKSLPHNGVSLPSILAATVLIQLQPTTTKFLSLTELTSLSLTTTTCPPRPPETPPGEIAEAIAPT